MDSTTAADFVKQVNSKIGNKEWAYVKTPGEVQDYEFNGDGYYILE